MPASLDHGSEEVCIIGSTRNIEEISNYLYPAFSSQPYLLMSISYLLLRKQSIHPLQIKKNYI